MYKDLNNIIVIFSTFENYLYRLFYVIMDDFSCELVFFGEWWFRERNETCTFSIFFSL